MTDAMHEKITALYERLVSSLALADELEMTIVGIHIEEALNALRNDGSIGMTMSADSRLRA